MSDAKLHSLVFLMEYLSQISNSFLTSSGDSHLTWIAILTKLLPAWDASLSSLLDMHSNLHCRLVLCCLSITKMLLIHHSHLLTLEKWKTNLKELKVSLLNDTEYVLVDMERDLQWTEVSVILDEENSKTLLDQMVALMEHLACIEPSGFETSLLTDSIPEHPSLLSHILPSELLLPVQQHALLGNYQSLTCGLEHRATDESLRPLSVVLERFAEVVTVVETYVAARKVEEAKPRRMFEKALYAIENGTRDSKGWLIFLLV